jgi:hypothetical protein
MKSLISTSAVVAGITWTVVMAAATVQGPSSSGHRSPVMRPAAIGGSGPQQLCKTCTEGNSTEEDWIADSNSCPFYTPRLNMYKTCTQYNCVNGNFWSETARGAGNCTLYPDSAEPTCPSGYNCAPPF